MREPCAAGGGGGGQGPPGGPGAGPNGPGGPGGPQGPGGPNGPASPSNSNSPGGPGGPQGPPGGGPPGGGPPPGPPPEAGGFLRPGSFLVMPPSVYAYSGCSCYPGYTPLVSSSSYTGEDVVISTISTITCIPRRDFDHLHHHMHSTS